MRRDRARRPGEVRPALDLTVTLSAIILAPIVVIAGEPLRRYCGWRLARRGPRGRARARAIWRNWTLLELTRPGRWVIDRVQRRFARATTGPRRGRGPGGGWPPPSEVNEPRRPRPTAPAGAIALAEPQVQRRVIPIRKAQPTELSAPVRRPRRQLRQLAGLHYKWTRRAV